MRTVADKVNDVLSKLDQFEDSNRKLSAKVREISSATQGEEDKRRLVKELVNEQLNEMGQ